METTMIREYSKSELSRLLQEPGFWQLDNLPFTKLRLAQYLANPIAEDDDILWLMAFINERIVGYLGVIPDRIKIDDQVDKFGWPTSWWIDPEHRGSGLADRLMQRLAELYPRMAANSGTPRALEKLQQSGLMQIYGKRPRTWYFLNLNASVLHDFKRDGKLVMDILPVLRLIGSTISKFRLKKWLATSAAPVLKVDLLDKPDIGALVTLKDLWQNDFTYKDATSFVWQNSNPAFAPRLKGVESLKSTYFGNNGYHNMSFQVLLHHGDKPVGWLSMVISDGVLKLPFIYLKPGYERGLLDLLAKICLSNGVDVIYSQSSSLLEQMDKHGFPCLFRKSYKMKLLISKSLAALPKGRILQDGDGAF